jgi:hypothetical protein
MKCAKKWIGTLVILCCVAFGWTPVLAYVSEGPCVDADNNNLKVSGFINSSEVDYKLKFDDGGELDTEVERKFIGIGLTKRVNKKMDIYGSLGYLFDGSLKPEGGDDFDLDSGYFLSAGARYMMVQSGNVSAHIFGQLDYILEEQFSRSSNGVDFDMEFDGYELSIGGAIRLQINNNFSTYAGISFVPLADTTMDAEVRGGGLTLNGGGDLERDDDLGFKVGASYLIDKQWSIRGEADFVSDNAFVLSAGMKF